MIQTGPLSGVRVSWADRKMSIPIRNLYYLFSYAWRHFPPGGEAEVGVRRQIIRDVWLPDVQEVWLIWFELSSGSGVVQAP